MKRHAPAEHPGVQRMLEDIRREVEMTRGYTGLSTFSPAVMHAMATVPRHLFVPEEQLAYAYHNGPLPIGHQQTISQPYIVALMTELLEVGPDATVLEIGTGSGYQAAVLAKLVKWVYSIEIIAPLGDEARRRLHDLGYDNITTRVSDGYHGWPEHAPYDGIIVTAAAPHIPEPLLDQLKPGGRLVIPVGAPFFGQDLQVLTRLPDGRVQRESVLPVAFVPLTRSREEP